jgi:lysyl-tRNA synthetase class 2
MTEDKKAVLNLLKSSSPMDLNELKEQTGLSNKKWDKAIKGLTQNKHAKVEKTEEGLRVSVV